MVRTLELPATIPSLALSDTLTRTRHGARLVLSYDSTTNAFTGTVENTMDYTLSNVRVTVYQANARYEAFFSEGMGEIQLNTTALGGLASSQVVELTIPAGSLPFLSWGAHPDIC